MLRRSIPRHVRRNSAQKSTILLNSGSDSYSPCPIPPYCAPWPENRNTTGIPFSDAIPEITRFEVGRRRALVASIRSQQTMARRTPKPLRPTWQVYAASAKFVEFSERWRARLRHSASTAEDDFADRVRSCQGRESPEVVSGASSRFACALVPPIPSAVTPARRGWPFDSQGRSRVFTKNGVLLKSMSGFGFE